MKRLILLLVTVLTIVSVKAETFAERMEHIYEDSIEVGLLTCYPGDVVYSLYGHTAIRFHNITTNEDLTFNYGIFDFRQKFFVARFVAGKTDYQLGLCRMKTFVKEYTAERRKVVEQVLNLNQEQKVKLFLALYDNWLPENCTYRYNLFYDNCTTRARNIIYQAINSDTCAIAYDWQDASSASRAEATTWREALHTYTDSHEWAKIGNDFALGQPADKVMTDEERQFLPINLMEDFSRATIVSNGQSVPLVVETRTIISDFDEEASFALPTPLQVIAILALICVIIFLIEIKKKKIILFFDTILLSLVGVAGIVLFILALSSHPAMFINWQILVLTPLALVALPFLWKATKAGKLCWWDYYIFVATIVLWLIGVAKVQDIPMFTHILAACLITRCLVRRIIFCNFADKHSETILGFR